MKQILLIFILMSNFQLAQTQDKLHLNFDTNVELDQNELERISIEYERVSFFKRNKFYSSHLQSLNEVSHKDSLSEYIYRFTYLRTFHNAIVIGLENKNDTIQIYWKVSDGLGGYQSGKIIEYKTKQLSISDWNDFERKIEDIDFWNLPIENTWFGYDGSGWLLEGKRLKQYHIVNRWCGQELTSIGRMLIKFTDLEIKIY